MTTSAPRPRRTVLHVAPHPDDESIAAPCTLLALQDAGWRVVNFAASLGRPAQVDRRRAELTSALELAGFELRESQNMPSISRDDPRGRACRTLVAEIAEVVRDVGADLVLGPHPRDGHHGHLTVARAVRQVVWQAQGELTWWMWSVWADLPRPTLAVECTDDHLALSLKMLDAHVGGLQRSDYREMHEAIRRVNAVRGVEKMLGYGVEPGPELKRLTRAEMLTEVTVDRRRWMIGEPRLLDPADPGTPRWHRLDDSSILSSARVRLAFPPWALSISARYGPFTNPGPVEWLRRNPDPVGWLRKRTARSTSSRPTTT